MNKQTETNINEAINWVQQTGGSIQNFATEQAPLYCTEVVMWTFWSGFLIVIVGAMLLTISALVFRKANRMVGKKNNYSDVLPIFMWLFSFILVLFAFTAIVKGSHKMAKAKISPRVVIIEHLQDLSRR